MTEIKLIVKDTEIPLANVDSFVFTSDIFSLYNMAILTIKDMSKELFNKVLIGTRVLVVFQKGSQVSTIYMNVLSFEKVPSPQTSMIDSVTMQLISEWYFNSAILTRAHSGNVGTIIQDIFQQMYVGVPTNILPTEDFVTLRYQIGESSQDFMKRLTRYGIRGSMPVYLYSNSYGTVELKGLSDFCKDTPKKICIPDLALLQDADAIAGLEVLRLGDYSFCSDNETSSSLTQTIFTTKHFLAPKMLSKSITLNNAEINNDQSECYTPKRLNYTGWEYTPDDALAISLHENFENNATGLYLTGNLAGNFHGTLEVGTQVRVLLPFKPTIGIRSGKETNLGEGTYTIKRLSFSYSGNLYNTQITLINT